MEFTRSGYLNTANEFNPMISPVRITGRWTFAENDRDRLAILTRSDGVPNVSYSCETANGLEALINNQLDLILIYERPSNTVLAQTFIEVNAGETFEFEVVDDGSSMTFSAMEIGGDASSASISAPSSLNTGANLITFHNREKPSHSSYLDHVAIGCPVDSVSPVTGVDLDPTPVASRLAIRAAPNPTI